MEGILSVFEAPTWGADSTSPQPPEARTRLSQQSDNNNPGNNIVDDRRVQANSIRGRMFIKKKD